MYKENFTNFKEKMDSLSSAIKILENVNETANFAIKATGQSTPVDVGFCNGILYMLKCITKNENIEFFDVQNCKKLDNNLIIRGNRNE